ncbi:MAG: gamma-glutamyltransferase, partial [Acidobacteria bacterium]|nr:gamma-glutamyltransferase [Acidobacteriota bacterium]
MRVQIHRACMSLVFLMAVHAAEPAFAQRTAKPVLHGRHWVAITGKPLGATAGAMMFQKGGNAVDAGCAMLAAVCTMWDMFSWGGETQALIYNPHTKKVIALNGLGVAPTGATAEFFKSKGLRYPPAYGPLAAVTPGTPGGLMTMLAEWGRLSLREVLGPAIQLADGYPIESELAELIERQKRRIKEWKYSRTVFLTHPGEEHEAPEAGEIFRQPDLAATLRKLVEAERQAFKAGKSRKEAIQAAYDRFYRGDIAQEIARGMKEEGGLMTADDLARWKPYIEEPVMTTYKGIEVYKLNCWVQGPVMLQALNMLENMDLRAMGYNSARYIHTLYQVMNLAFADRDFYYGDPYFPPDEPIQGLLSKSYAAERVKLMNPDRNETKVKPGDPYPFMNRTNPFKELLDAWPPARPEVKNVEESPARLQRGTTSIQAADEEGWVVSVTPSGGWVPSFIAGRSGIGMSQRMQSFVLYPAENPFNVVDPGKRPRATLTP